MSLRRSRTSAAERTNDSATKSTPSPSANSRSIVSFRVSDGNRERHAGQVDALVRGDRPADQHGAVRAAVLDVLHLQADQPVVDQHVVARAGARRRSRRG